MESGKENPKGGQIRPEDVLRGLARRAGLVRLMRALRTQGARLVHPIHRGRALRRLQEGRPPRSVVFICHGNIYRSPYAEHLFRKLLPEGIAERLRISSAGFVGPGRGTPEAAMVLAGSRGVDLGQHRSSRITHDRIDDETLVVVMESGQERAIRMVTMRGQVLVLGDLDPEPGARTIQDPWSESEEVLRRSYDRVERCIRVLVDVLASGIPAGGKSQSRAPELPAARAGKAGDSA
jgi:protein-tyrosine phosphatase